MKNFYMKTVFYQIKESTIFSLVVAVTEKAKIEIMS